MTRAQFLNDLYRLLAGNGMSGEQAEQHLTYYAEMLADRMEEGMTEEQAVSSMEDVETIARRILEEEGKVFRPLKEIPAAPPARPDPPKPDGRKFQVPKKWDRRKIAQALLWALAIVIALGAVSRWVGGRTMRAPEFLEAPEAPLAPEAPNFVDGTSTVAEDIPAEMPDTEWYESYALEAPYEYGYEHYGREVTLVGDHIDSIDIQWASGMVFVQSWDSSDIQIREYANYELNERSKLYSNVEDGELTIRYREGTGLGTVKGDKWLSVLVPDGILEELEIETTSAGVQLISLEQGEADVSTTSGDVQIMDCYFRKADVETVSGDVYVTVLHADEADLSTTSGDISGDVDCGDVEASTASGDINLQTTECMERIQLDTVSGDVWLGVNNASVQSISAETTSGDVFLSLPCDTGFTLDYSTVSGDFSSSFDAIRQNGKIIYDGGGYEIKVETVSGNLEIY